MKKLTVEVEGETNVELEVALDKVKEQIREGFLIGKGETETGSYFFDVKGGEEG